jgi:alpha-ketoglutarate-dependent taurine dioxygenase
MEPLEPFGLAIYARQGEGIREISSSLLDRILTLEKLVLLRGFAPLEREAFLAFCRTYPGKDLLEWDFGPVMEMKESADPKNYLFSREPVPYHWDGAFHRVPHYLAFNCVQAPVADAGGETLFANTEMIFAQADAVTRERWAKVVLTYRTEKKAHYGGAITNPLVQLHPTTGQPILRFAEPVTTDLNPVTMEVAGLPEEDEAAFVDDMRQRAYSPAFCYEHEWQEGDILIADNHALIHGRHGFAKDCPRHLRRIQLI